MLDVSQLKPGSRHVVTVQDVAFGGEGVARLDEFVIFVPFVLTGEEVEVELTEVKKKFGRANLVRVIKPSPERVKPECQYYMDCGGCQYQHISYAAQLEIKHKQISDLLQRLGNIAPERVTPVIPCPEPYGYRNRIMIRSQWNGRLKKLHIGYVAQDSRFVVDVEECKIAEKVLSDQIPAVRANPPPKGGLKVVLRIPPEGWEVPENSFFQNNFFLLPKLIEAVRDRIKDAGTSHLVDAYCGVGFFGIELAKYVESFAGVELDIPAIKAARKNLANRGLTNGEFIAGQTEVELPKLMAKFDAAKTTVIIDPPRKGCHPGAITCLRENRPAQILYVSCHPATLARDLNLLCADGVYEVVQVVPLDMFPQTQHVECVADLRLCKSVEV
ncbi:MAG TPA: class I SAM-dependent RNA methyltransferase [Verrucomicrobiae bacterium]